MEESWAQPTIQWLLTPALITGALYALARLYDPAVRWSRNLKADMSIAGGLPEGEERTLWEQSVEAQAWRLRMYREAFTGWTRVFKWAAVAFVGFAVFGLILYPPFGGEYGPADFALMLLGLLNCLLIAVFISQGYDLTGRNPLEILRRRRARDYDRRFRKLRRIEKVRTRRALEDPSINPEGSRLGFRTQVDEYGVWVRDSDLRILVKVSGLMGADIAARTRDRLRERGVEIPTGP